LQFSSGRTIKNYHKQKNLSIGNCKNCNKIIDFLQQINNAIPQKRRYMIPQLNNSPLVNQGQNILHFDLLPKKLLCLNCANSKITAISTKYTGLSFKRYGYKPGKIRQLGS